MKKLRYTLNSGNACYNYVQKLLFYRLLSENLNIKIHKTIFTWCFVWAWNFAYHTTGRTKSEYVWEQGSEENILT